MWRSIRVTVAERQLNGLGLIHIFGPRITQPISLDDPRLLIQIQMSDSTHILYKNIKRIEKGTRRSQFLILA